MTVSTMASRLAAPVPRTPEGGSYVQTDGSPRRAYGRRGGADRRDRRPIGVATTTVSVAGTAQLIGKVVAQVPVTATCGPFDPALPFSFGTSVTLTQAPAKEIAQGSAFVGVNTTGQTVPVRCDGTPQSFVVSVSANPSGPPFKNRGDRRDHPDSRR